MIMSSLGMSKSWNDVKFKGILTCSIHQTTYLKHWQTYSKLHCTIKTIEQCFPITFLRHLIPQRESKTFCSKMQPHQPRPHLNCQRRFLRRQKWRAPRKKRGLQNIFQLPKISSLSLRRRLAVVPGQVCRWWSDWTRHRRACTWHWVVRPQQLAHLIGLYSVRSDANYG